MMELIVSLTRKLAKLFLPFSWREKIRTMLFKGFRHSSVLPWLSKTGLLIYKNYIAIDLSNVGQKFNHPDVKIYILEEKDKVRSPICIYGDNLESIHSFTAITTSIYLEIKNADFSFRNNHLLDGQLNIIGEARSQESDRMMPLPISKQIISKTHRIAGTVAYLSDPDPGNYYHWMCRTFPLLRIYQKFINSQEIDFFYVGQVKLASFHKESLRRLGIEETKILQEACVADKLMMAVTNRTLDYGDSINKEAYLFSRSMFANELTQTGGGQRLYVERGNTVRRKIINESEVINLLVNKYSFTVVSMDGRTIKEQANLFAQAEAIVAAHGAALTNLLFVQPGTKVIELMPQGYINNCFYTMSSYAEADYFCLQSEEVEHPESLDRRYLNLCIDLKKLNQICDLALLPRSVIRTT